ncbi:uncharacterized protein BO66DRAFT_100705, partial [Aspergillus aculeatinus CBS 121060]
WRTPSRSRSLRPNRLDLFTLGLVKRLVTERRAIESVDRVVRPQGRDRVMLRLEHNPIFFKIHLFADLALFELILQDLSLLELHLFILHPFILLHLDLDPESVHPLFLFLFLYNLKPHLILFLHLNLHFNLQFRFLNHHPDPHPLLLHLLLHFNDWILNLHLNPLPTLLQILNPRPPQRKPMHPEKMQLPGKLPVEMPPAAPAGLRLGPVDHPMMPPEVAQRRKHPLAVRARPPHRRHADEPPGLLVEAADRRAGVVALARGAFGGQGPDFAREGEDLRGWGGRGVLFGGAL